MSNRKQPFGYKICNGEMVTFPTEAELVEKIFKEYLLGSSFTEITEMLRNQDITYDDGKSWNKNMVARILGDQRYTGNDMYPQIIPADDYEDASQKRASKAILSNKTEAQKMLRRLCSGTVNGHVESQVLNLLNCLISNPAIIQQPVATHIERKSVELKAELEKLMIVQPIDVEKANELIYMITAAQYEEIDNSEYETEHIRRMLYAAKPLAELNAEILRSCISSILASHGEVSIVLKNRQIIRKADFQ